jgi:hypothetical protein
VASLLLVVFSIGIGVGSLLCERLSRGTVEIGLVPLGALGMSVFTIDFWLATRSLPASELMGLAPFWRSRRIGGCCSIWGCSA